MLKNLSQSLRDQRDKFKQKQKEAKSWGQDLRTMRLNRDAADKAIVKFTAEVRAIEAKVEQTRKKIETDYQKKAKKLAEDKQNIEDQIAIVKEKYIKECSKKEEADAMVEKCKSYEADSGAKFKDPEPKRQLRKCNLS